MSKSVALALAMMVATAPLALAQTAAPTTPAHPAKTTTSTSFVTPSGQLRANKIIGSSVYDRDNQDIGSVKDIVLDENGGAPNVVVDVGAFLGMGGKYVSIPIKEFKTDNDRLTVARTKDQLKTAPAYELASDQKS